jgi:20S proteasome alpha/beta subunit
MGFVTPEFVMICGDKRICRNGNIHSEDFRKVYYFNDNIILGFAGKVIRNFEFISEYLQDFNLLSDESYKIDYNITENISFQELSEALTLKLENAKKEYEESHVSPDIEIMIGTVSNGESIMRRFYILDDKIGIDESREEEGALAYLIFGNELQESLLNQELASVEKLTINNLQSVFQEVLNVAADSDAGINKNMNAVFIENKHDVTGQLIPGTETPVGMKAGILSGKIKIECQKVECFNCPDDYYA